MSNNQTHILSVLKNISFEKQEDIDKEIADSIAAGKREDWPWNGIIMSFATYQMASHWEKIAPRYDEDFSWRAVSSLSDKERRLRFEEVNGRYWKKTANWTEVAFQTFRNSGGPAGIRKKLQGMTKEEVIKFWEKLPGIREKISRNIMMYGYDSRFQNGSIAVDLQIKNLLPYLGYQNPENFLNALAKKLGITSWHLDRLLFQNADEIIKRLSK